MTKTKKISDNQKKSKIRKKAFRRTNKRSYKGGIKLGKYNYNITQKIRDKFGNIKDNFKSIKSNTTQKIRDKLGNIKDNFKNIKSNFTQKIRDKFGYIKEKLNNIKTAFTNSKSKKDQDEQYNKLEELINKESGFNYVVDYAELKDTYLQYKISDALRIVESDITLYAFYNINLNERLFLLRNNFVRFPKGIFKNQYYILKILVYVISFIPANAFAFVILLVLTIILAGFGASADRAGEEIVDTINAPIYSGIINNYRNIKKPEFISKSYAFLEKIANKFSSKSNNNEIEENIIATQDKLHGWDNNYKSLEFLENKSPWKNRKGIFFIYNNKYEKFVTINNDSDQGNPSNVFGFISTSISKYYNKYNKNYNDIFNDIIREFKEENMKEFDDSNKEKYNTTPKYNLDRYTLDGQYLIGNLDKQKLDELFNIEITDEKVEPVLLDFSEKEKRTIDNNIINTTDALENIVSDDNIISKIITNEIVINETKDEKDEKDEKDTIDLTNIQLVEEKKDNN